MNAPGIGERLLALETAVAELRALIQGVLGTTSKPEPAVQSEPSELEHLAQRLGNARLAAVLVRAGYTSIEAVAAAPDAALLAVDGVGDKALKLIPRESRITAAAMATSATTLKTALLSLVGASLSTDGWEDPVLAEALVQGLADLNAWLPPIESSFTVTTPGAELDLNSLSPQQILALATPWESTSEWRTAAVPWRLTAPGVVMLPEAAAAEPDRAGTISQAVHCPGPQRCAGNDAAAGGRAHPAAGGGSTCVFDPLPATLAPAEHSAQRSGFVQGVG